MRRTTDYLDVATREKFRDNMLNECKKNYDRLVKELGEDFDRKNNKD